MTTPTGANTIVVYRWEDDGTFNQDVGSPSDTTDKVFGANETLDTADFSNNPERMNRPFQRHAETILETQFDGSWSTEFVLANTWWLQYFYGQPETNGTSAPYTHTYDTDPTVGPNDYNPPRSAHIIEEIHLPDGSVTQNVYKGVVAGSIDLDVSVEDTVSISLDGNYADSQSYDDPENNSPLGEIASQPSLDYRPMHFGNSILRLDVDADGTAETLAKVQDAGLGLEGNAEMTRELGTRFAVGREYLEFEPSIDYTRLLDASFSDEERESAYGAAYNSTASSPQETMDGAEIDGELEFDANTSTDNKLVMNLLGAFPEEFSRSNLGDPGEALEDDITRMIEEVTATVESDQQAPP